MNVTHSRLIDSLGGDDELATKLAGLVDGAPNREAIRKWRRNGVPWRWRAAVSKAAKRGRVAVPVGFIGVEERQERTAQP